MKTRCKTPETPVHRDTTRNTETPRHRDPETLGHQDVGTPDANNFGLNSILFLWATLRLIREVRGSTKREEKRVINKEVAETRYLHEKQRHIGETFADLIRNVILLPDGPAFKERCNPFLVGDSFHPKEKIH